MDEAESFEGYLAWLRKNVGKMCDSHLNEAYHFFMENLLKTRLLIKTVDTVPSSSKELATDSLNEQRWCILIEVCEAELKRRGVDVSGVLGED